VDLARFKEFNRYEVEKMASRAVLFDIDGVIVRTSTISNTIERQAVKYVQMRTKVQVKQAAALNRTLYSTYGHTHTGLKNAYDIRETIQDYNAFVYNRETVLSCFRELVARAAEHEDSIETIAALQARGVPVYLFTNAPDVWADAVVQALHLDIPMERRITSSCGFGVKTADLQIYDKVQNHVKNVDDVSNILYVEDQFRNLAPILHKPNWVPVLFDPSIADKTTPVWIGRTQVIHELDEVVRIL